MALPILDGNQTAATLSTVLTGGEHIPAHTVVSLGSQAITDMRSAVSGSVVSISNFPSTQTIAGTVTANLFGEAVGGAPNEPTKLQCDSNGFLITSLYRSGSDAVNYDPVAGNVSVNVKNISSVTIGNSVTIGSLPAISGTVTANNALLTANTGYNNQDGSAAFGVAGLDVNAIRTVIYSSANATFSDDAGAPVDSSNPLPISGTVTANNPSGALTTRFGSVTTANTAQITTAVTNASRKYLLAQNISAGTVTIGIGFSPTTTQGIQLTAGGGLTFDAFCPTGAVYWLGAVTGAAFTILEG